MGAAERFLAGSLAISFIINVITIALVILAERNMRKQIEKAKTEAFKS